MECRRVLWITVFRDDAHLQRLLLVSTVIQLQVDEYFVPDLEPPEDYLGPHLVATAHAGRLAMLSPQGQLAREISDETMAALLQAATRARDEKPHALPPNWSAVLRTMRDAAGVLGESAAEVWDRALTWTSPVEIGPVFTAGLALRLPHRVTSFAHEGALYLRTDQPPQSSSLYLFSDSALTCVDDRRVIAPSEGRFILPCGGGTLTVRREWQKPPRFVIRCNDDRGLYVQRG